VVARALRDLKRSGLISAFWSGITILDEPGLRQVLERDPRYR
jgi:hypothetical protein